MAVWRENRLIVSAAATEGAILASFCASVSILLARHDYDLSASQYSAVFLLQVITGVSAALIAARSAMRFSRGRALRLGLSLSILGLLLMIGALAPGARSASQLPLLLIASGLAGGGFGFVYPALTAFALDASPSHAERSVLALNLILAAGLVVSPGLAVAAERAGVWWALAAVLCILALLIMAGAGRSRLGPDALRSCNLHRPRQHYSVWSKLYPVLALLACTCAIMLTGWAQIHRPGQAVPHPGFSLLLLASFWAGAVTAARVAFAAIERRETWQRSTSLLPFLLAASVAVTGLAIGQTQTATVGVFLLAAVVCAAFFPLPASPGTDQLLLLSLAFTAGLIGLYPAGLGIAGPAMGQMKGSASLLAIFVGTGAIGVAAGLIGACLPVWRRAPPVRPGPGLPLRGSGAVLVAAQADAEAAERAPAGRAEKTAPRPRQDTSPVSHSHSASAAPASRESDWDRTARTGEAVRRPRQN
jgi:MFS family permease